LIGSTTTIVVVLAVVGLGIAGRGIEGGLLKVIASPSALALEEMGPGVASKSGKADFSSTGVRGGEGDEAALEGVLA
jgi:hypothetical protein